MPLYDYECLDCGAEFELLFPMKKWKVAPLCPNCNGKSKKILKPGHGGIQTDTPVWIDNSVRAQLQDSDIPEKPIETRAELKRVLEKNSLQPKN
jgi:putative FmdB family regulatory protein